MKKIKRICILLDEPLMLKCFVLAFEKALKENKITIPLIIIRSRKSYRFRLNLRKEFLKIIIVYGRKLIGIEPKLLSKVHINQIKIFKKSEIIFLPAIKEDKHNTILSEESIDLIKSKNIDLIIRRGFGILKGGALYCVPRGVISYHPGRLSNYRGAMSPVNAYINQEKYIYLSVQRINEFLDRGDLVMEFPIDISRARSYYEVNKLLCEEIITSLSKVIKRMNADDFKFVSYKKEKQGYYGMPNILGFSILTFRYFIAEIKRQINQLRKRYQQNE